MVQSIKSMERHFNRWFHYPYVFLNDGDFNTTFKETILNHTSAPVEFGKIDPTMWGYPDWVNVDTAREGIRKQGDAAIMYGGMESYHHMCRFYSGFVLDSARYTFSLLTDNLASSTSMSFYRSTTGTGELSQKSNTFATSHSESPLAEVAGVSKCS